MKPFTKIIITAVLPFFIFNFELPFCFGQTYINENFNTGIPSSWTITTTGCTSSYGTTVWKGTTNGWRGQGLAPFSLDTTEFAVVDSDQPGTYCNSNEFLTSPVFDATASATLLLTFDHYFKHYTNDAASVEVFDGVSWVVAASFTSNTGGWMSPDKQSIDIAPYKNAAMQIRFRYQSNWDWFWALDNIRVTENSATSVNETSSSDAMEVYPNPASQFVTVEAAFNQAASCEISLSTVLGENLFVESTAKSKSIKKTIPITLLPLGIYVIVVKSENGISFRKFIKQ